MLRWIIEYIPEPLWSNHLFIPVCKLISVGNRSPWPCLDIKTVFLIMKFPWKDRRFRDRLIFMMGISILAKRHLHIETAPSPYQGNHPCGLHGDKRVVHCRMVHNYRPLGYVLVANWLVVRRPKLLTRFCGWYVATSRLSRRPGPRFNIR